jgi:hypothetical protein
VETRPEEFKQKVEAFLDSHPGSWIVDGDYMRIIGSTVQDAATDVLCMVSSLD